MSALPNLLLVGAMRSGSTALASALAAHPEISMCEPKEPNYFATKCGALDFEGPGDRWFADQNVSQWDAYTALFDESAKVRGEASAMYLALPETAAEAAAAVPKAKVVVILRHPLARARSAHGYLLTRGRERVKDFVAALKLEQPRREAAYGPMWWYLGASDYAPGLTAYFDAFGRSNVHVVISEDLDRDPALEVNRVLEFLEVPFDPGPLAVLEHRINSGGAPRSMVLTRFLYPPDRVRRLLRRLASPRLVEWVRAARRSSLRSSETAEVPARVLEQVNSYVAATETVLGRRVHAWSPTSGDPS